MALTSLLLASSALVSGPAFAADITVTDAASLSAAIAGASAGDRILLQNDIALGTTLLPPVLSNITIDGNGHTIDAGGNNRIFFLDSTATIQNVTLTGGKATGGNGGGINSTSGGGGLGAGGAIFVNSGTATVANVAFTNNTATGGNAGTTAPLGTGTLGGGGGGGLGGSGGSGGQDAGGGGGGYSGGGGGAGGSTGAVTTYVGVGGDGPGGAGGNGGSGAAGSNGVNGGAGGAVNTNPGIPGWTMGGGGGGGGLNGGTGGDGSLANVNGGGGGGGGGLASGNGGNGGTQLGFGSTAATNGTTGGGGGGAAASNSSGGNGGDFGGGGGGTNSAGAGNGGFGGGGGGAGGAGTGGTGGFGGGGGSGAFYSTPGAGGVGGGNATASIAGGGAGFGGAVFVRDGASLNITDGSFAGGSVTGGNGGGNNGAAAGTDLFLMNGATTTFNPTGTLTFNGTIADDSAASVPTGQSFTAGTGAGAAIAISGGTVALNGANTYSGGTTVNNGAVASAGNNAAFGTGGVTLDNGTIQAGADNLNLANAITLGAGNGTVDSNGKTLTLSGVIADGAGNSLTKTGTGTLILTNSGNTYSGGTTVSAGTLQLTDNNAASTGRITLNGGTLQPGVDNLTIANAIGLGNNGGTVDTQAYTLTLSGTITDTTAQPGSLTKIGSGELILTSSGTSSYTGATNVEAGTLTVGAYRAVPLGTAVTVNSGATFKIADNTGFNEIGSLANGTSGGGTVSIGTTAGLNIGNGGANTANTTFGGTFTGAGDLQYTGGGKLTLTGTGSQIGAGLTVGAAAASRTGPAGELDISGGTFETGTGVFVIDGKLTVSNGGTLTSDTTPIISGTSSAQILVTGTGSNLKASGGFTVGDFIPLPGSGKLTIADGGTVTMLTNNNLDIGAHGILELGTGGLAGTFAGPSIQNDGQIVANFTDSSALTATVSGNGSVTKKGSGTLTLSGASNSYSGGTFLQGGTLELTNTSSLGAGSLTMEAGTTLFIQSSFGSFSNDVTLNGLATVKVNSAASGPFAGIPIVMQSSGTISGNGGLIKTGDSTLVLMGTNTYHGGTVLTQGTVQVTNASSLGDGTITFNGGTLEPGANNLTLTNAGAINAAGGTVNVNAATTFTLSGAIGDGIGAGTLTKTGDGVLILSGNSTFSGGTSLQGGTLRLGSNNALGTGGLATSGTVTVDYANGVTIGNAITTTGGATSLNTDTGITAHQTGAVTATGQTIYKTGDGTLTVDNVNAGPVYILAGTLQGGALNAFGSNATVYIANSFLDLGGYNQSIADLQMAPGGTVTNNGAAAATLTLTPSSGTTTLGGTLADGTKTLGLTLNGASDSTIVLTGTNTYSGATTVTSGALQVDGSITSASTVSGGILSGTGQVGAVTVNSGGTLVGGTAGTPGTLTVNGNLTMNAGANYVVFANPTLIGNTLVTGTASLNGAVFVNAQTGQRYQAGQYTLMTVQGGITGGTTFSALNTLGFGYSVRNPRLSYDATHVYLLLDIGTITPLLNGSAGRNQRNVAAGIDNALIGGSNPSTAFQNLFNLQGNALNNGLAQISGESSGGIAQAGVQFTTAFLNMMLNPFGGAPSGNPGALGYARPVGANISPEAAAAYAAVTPRDKRERVDSFAARWSVWGGGFGGQNKTSGDATAGTSDLTARAYGFAAGADYRATPTTLLGFALAGGGTNWSVAQVTGGGRSDVFQIGAYGSQQFGAAYISGALTYGWHSVRTDRTVTVGGTDRLGASFNAHSFGGRVEAGYRFAMPAIAVTPYAAFQAQNFRTPAYGEAATSGLGTFALDYAARSTTATRIELGTWLDRTFILAHGDALSLRARAAWAHDHADTGIGAAFQTLPGSSFTVSGTAMPADSALLTLGAEYRMASGLSFAAKFDSELSGKGQTYGGLGSVRYAW